MSALGRPDGMPTQLRDQADPDTAPVHDEADFPERLRRVAAWLVNGAAVGDNRGRTVQKRSAWRYRCPSCRREHTIGWRLLPVVHVPRCKGTRIVLVPAGEDPAAYRPGRATARAVAS